MPEWPWEWDCPGCIFEAIDFIKLTLTHWDRSGVVQAARSNLRGAVFVYNVTRELSLSLKAGPSFWQLDHCEQRCHCVNNVNADPQTHLVTLGCKSIGPLEIRGGESSQGWKSFVASKPSG